jgi:hypothetical protein
LGSTFTVELPLLISVTPSNHSRVIIGGAERVTA